MTKKTDTAGAPGATQARRIISAQLDEATEKLHKADRRLESLDRQKASVRAHREEIKATILGLTQALETLGGPVLDENDGAKAGKP